MAVVLCVVPGAEAQPASPASPAYTADGRLEFPKTYRTWVYLSSGLDMSYLPSTAGRMSTFGNVFVNPVSHESFLKTGTWPDKTVLVLEIRRAEENGSINKSGRFQSDSLRTEIHVKDTARFGGGWAFFAYSDETPAQMIPRSANCYSCHQANGAVDTTFVQFYPTLLPIARAKQTLSTGYLATESRDAPRK
jgi:hypothetical protein